ncbi:MAG: BACON domain-containing protein [Candidatus Cryptobacteroides sp.]
MRARSFLFALAALTLCAACNPQEDAPEVKAAISVTGVKDNAITVPAAGKTVTLTVVSNVSWEATCEADWVTLTPASLEITDHEQKSQKVSVWVKEYTGTDAPRTTTVVVTAEGVDPVQIALTQTAVEVVPAAIAVLDENFAPVENFSVALDYNYQLTTFVVSATADWTVETPEWIHVEPASFTYDGSNTDVNLQVTVAENAGDERTGDIVFSGDFEKGLSVPVKQGVSKKFTLTSEPTKHPYSEVDLRITPEDPEMYYRCRLYNASTLETYGIAAVKADVLDNLNGFLATYSPETVIKAALYQGEDSIQTELPEDSEFALIVVGVEYDATKEEFVAVSAAFSLVFATEKAPEASADYSAYVGVWTIPVNYVDVIVDEDGQPILGEDGKKQYGIFSGVSPVVVEPQFVNESYYIYFPGDDVTPVYVDGQDVYVDSYVGLYDEENKSLVIPNVQVGTEGFSWDFGLGMYNAVALVFSSDISNFGATSDETEEYLDYVELKTNGSNLEFVDLGLEEGYSLYITGLIVAETETGVAPTGYYGNNEVTSTVLSPYVESSSVKKASVSKGLKAIDFKSEKTLSVKSATLK